MVGEDVCNIVGRKLFFQIVRGIVPFWIKGWIETSTGPISDSPIWFATVNLAPLIDTWDEVSETLFGLSKRIARDQARMQDALFPSRGLPVDISEIVQVEVDQGSSYPSEIGGYTHASVGEIERAGFEIGGFPNSDWFVVFKIIDCLLADERFTKDNLRIIVWSSW
jgi:hypothetical protein